MKQAEIERWIQDNRCVGKWLDRMSPSTRYPYAQVAYSYFKWVKEQGGLKWTNQDGEEHVAVTPQELLDCQDRMQGRNRYAQVDLLESWVRQFNGRYGTKKRMYHTIRSFYAHNRVVLPQDKGFKPRGDVPPVNGELTVEQFRKMVLSSNETYQAVLLIMFQAGMGSREFEWFNMNGYPQIKPQIAKGKLPIRIDLPGRKHSRFESPYYTFIHRDAVDALKRYMHKRGPIKPGEPIFMNNHGTPVTGQSLRKYFHRRAFRTGVIEPKAPACPECQGSCRKQLVSEKSRWYKDTKSRTKYVCNKCGHVFPATSETRRLLQGCRYGVSPHELRDLFRSELETSPAKGIVGEFLLGHNVDVNSYNKFFKTSPEWVEAQYNLVAPWLNILSEDPRKVSVNQVTDLMQKVERLEQQNVELKTRLNGFTLGSDQMSELLDRIKKLEEKAEQH